MLVEISTNAKIARAELTLTPASVIETVGIAVINKIDNTANTGIAIGPTKTEKISPSKFKRIFSVSNLTQGR